MKGCYAGTLVMPKNYAVMNEAEMTYVEGGDAEVSMSQNFLEKSYCTWYAAMLLRKSMVSGMLDHEIAEELYAHAVCYYKYSAVAAVVGVPLAYYCYCKARDGITIVNGGDTAVRKAGYATIWQLF